MTIPPLALPQGSAPRGYLKPALPCSDLLAHLVARGLTVLDSTEALQSLENIGYYRLLIYMRPLQSAAKLFNPGATFEQILTLYEFDRQLRLLCLDAIERVEVALRSAIVNSVGVQLGPHFYEDPRQFMTWYNHPKLLKKIDDAQSLGIEHYRTKYDQPTRPPIWVVLEAVTIGTLSQFFSGLTTKSRHAVGRFFSLDETVLVSWFRALTVLRNVCAHHGRLWNAQHPVDKPIAAKFYAAEFTSVTSAYARLVVLAVLLTDVDPTAQAWKQRLRDLFAQYPMINPTAVGCPAAWEMRSVWK